MTFNLVEITNQISHVSITQQFGELNLSTDPDATRNVLAAECAVRMFPVDVGLHAKFGWGDLSFLRQLNSWVVWNVVRWLCCFGVRYRSQRFYLWDLVPTLALTRPDLFERKQICVGTDVSDLEKGILNISPGGDRTIATKINSREAFLTEAFSAIQNAAHRVSKTRGAVRPIFG